MHTIMSSIVKFLLFVSSTSQASKQCVSSIQRYSLPINVIRLDTAEARNAAANGSMFQITVVPTLVVFYSDGNMQMFVGTPKIVAWVTQLVSAASKPPPSSHANPPSHGHQPPRSSNIYDTDPSDMMDREPDPIGIGPLPIPRGIPKKMPSRGYREPIIDEGDDMFYEQEPPMEPHRDRARVPTPGGHAPRIEYEEEPDEGIRGVQPPPYIVEDQGEDMYVEPEPPKKSKPRKRSTKKKGGPDPQQENPGLKEAKEKLNKASSSKSKPRDTKMKNVYAAAKQMQADMESSLGYKEEDLPHY